MNSEEQKAMIDSLEFANEFIKVSRGLFLEAKREDHLPEELLQHLANERLNEVMNRLKLEPEMLIYGMLEVIQLLMGLSEIEPEELTNSIDEVLKHSREKDNN